MINISIINEQNYDFKFVDSLNKAANAALKFEGIVNDSEICLVIIDNEQIQTMSKTYRDKDFPTDVLSFPADWRDISRFTKINTFGDIFISWEKVKFQSDEYNHSLEREWTYLFVHGLLHLIGYDHMNPDDEKTMNDKTNAIMNYIGIIR